MHTASLAGPASALPLHDLRRTLHSARPLWVSTVCVHLSTEPRTLRRPALHLLPSSRRLLTSLQMDYLGRYITLHTGVCGCGCVCVPASCAATVVSRRQPLPYRWSEVESLHWPLSPLCSFLASHAAIRQIFAPLRRGQKAAQRVLAHPSWPARPF
jgi:hypothetical protein